MACATFSRFSYLPCAYGAARELCRETLATQGFLRICRTCRQIRLKPKKAAIFYSSEVSRQAAGIPHGVCPDFLPPHSNMPPALPAAPLPVRPAVRGFAPAIARRPPPAGRLSLLPFGRAVPSSPGALRPLGSGLVGAAQGRRRWGAAPASSGAEGSAPGQWGGPKARSTAAAPPGRPGAMPAFRPRGLPVDISAVSVRMVYALQAFVWYISANKCMLVSVWLSKKWLAPLFRGVHSSLAPTARPGSYARKPLLRKAFCGFDAHVAKSDQSLRGLRPPNPRGFFDSLPLTSVCLLAFL